MCDCIKKTTESAQKQLVKDIESNCVVSEWINKGRYQNTGYSLSGGPTKIGMSFIMEYRKQKKNGEPEKNVTTKNVSVYPTYCPFCGKKYPEKD